MKNYRFNIQLNQLFVVLLSTWGLSQAQAQSIYNPSLNEYKNSTSVVQLGINGVHSKGIIGQGVTVAVLDTGLNLNNPEFKNNKRVLKGYNATNGSADVTDSIGHGTHVAGIIGASANGYGMYGVAPGANILPVKVFGGTYATSADLDRGLRYASAQRAKVINLSLGASGPTGNAVLGSLALTNNHLVVVSAGNDGGAHPIWPARYAKETWANGTIMAVGAVDAGKKIASFSNRAGDTANFYLVAPGVSVVSSYSSGYAYMSGTSAAAPAVSGAAALLFGYWPYLKANQVSAILLNTADDLGAPGVDAVYGRGMLNVNKALSPQGSFSYKAATGKTVKIALNSKVTSATQPRVSSPSAFSGLVTEVFDDYGRNFTSKEGAAMAARTEMTVDSVLGQTDQMLDVTQRVLADGSQLMSLRSNANQSLLQWQGPSGHAFSGGDGGMSAFGLGLMAAGQWGHRLGGVETLLVNPLTQFAPNHRFATYSVPLAAGITARAGTVRGQTPATTVQNQANANMQILELTHQGRRHAFNISTGLMLEQGLLGGFSNSAVGLDQSTQSLGTTLSGAVALTDSWTVAASLTRSKTQAPTAQGLLLSATAVKSDAWGLGLVKQNVMGLGDRLSFSLHAPLRASSGSLAYSVVEGVNEDGSPIYNTQVVNLRPLKRELMSEVRYVRQLSGNRSLTAVAALRQHPDHDALAAKQALVGVRYQASF